MMNDYLYAIVQHSTPVKKSLPLSSTRMKAGKSLTVDLADGLHAQLGVLEDFLTLVMLSLARRAAGPPIEPR